MAYVYNEYEAKGSTYIAYHSWRGDRCYIHCLFTCYWNRSKERTVIYGGTDGKCDRDCNLRADRGKEERPDADGPDTGRACKAGTCVRSLSETDDSGS